mgnify:CR=1 FL=1
MERRTIEVPGCEKTTVEDLLSEPGTQVMRVRVHPGGRIPLHSHECAATMVITEGRAYALGAGKSRYVDRGEVLVKGPGESHGFEDVREPFSFISISYDKGIMRPDGFDIRYI